MEVAWIRMKACRRSWIVVEEHFDGFSFTEGRDARHKAHAQSNFHGPCGSKRVNTLLVTQSDGS